MELTLGIAPASLIAGLGYMEQDGLVEAGEPWGAGEPERETLFRPTEAGLEWCRSHGIDVGQTRWRLFVEMTLRYTDDALRGNDRELGDLGQKIHDLRRRKRLVDREIRRRRRAGTWPEAE